MTETTTHTHMKMPQTWSGELKALLWIGVPMALAQLIQFFVMTIDILMIGRLGPSELAAAALGSVIYFLLWMIGFGPVMAVTPLISQALGADKDNIQDVRHTIRMALWTLVFMTPIMVAIVLFTEPLSILFGQDPTQSKQAAYYIFALAWGWPFALGIMVLRNFLAALEKTKIPLVLVIITTAINAGLNYLFIFGTFGFPRLELLGAGIASSLTYFIGFMMFVVYISFDKRAAQFEIFKNMFNMNWARMREIIKLGWPISITIVFEGMLFNACVLIMGLIGLIEVAAYQIALNIIALAFMLPYGLSMAGAIRVGLAVGADDHAAVKRAGITTTYTAIIGIMLFAIPIAISPTFVASLYMDPNMENSTAVLALVASFLPIAAAFMFFDAAQVALNQVVRGLKDVKWPMFAGGISYWVIGFPIAYILAIHTDMGPKGVWYGLLASLTVASVLLTYRFWHLVWKTSEWKTPKSS
ncbi:MAG: hypothetical protein COA43_05000 [Robiginitomaculum sp.]|nr:MAG: hypothetical protein COA43_05000 [Robiginitomaculum sp.]